VQLLLFGCVVGSHQVTQLYCVYLTVQYHSGRWGVGVAKDALGTWHGYWGWGVTFGGSFDFMQVWRFVIIVQQARGVCMTVLSCMQLLDWSLFYRIGQTWTDYGQGLGCVCSHIR
jgi:hypothetical protein